MRIRECKAEDLPILIDLWRRTGIKIGLSETEPEFKKILEQNPTTCLIGEQDGMIAAVVLGGFDGRRGLVHHLAVEPSLQGRGYGRIMMQELENRFNDMGIVKYHLWIEAWNTEVIKFYEHLGYELRDLITMTMTLRHE